MANNTPMMKKILILLAFLIGTGCTNAQTAVKDKPLVNYRILTTDSVFVTPKDLVKNKPVMLIYFSPDCSHCQQMMYELKPKMKQLEKFQVIMITWSNNYDIRALRDFRNTFDLAKYHNIIIGTEGYTYTVQRYYDVKTTPYIAIYNGKGVLKKAFNKTPKVEDVLAALKKV